MSRTLVQIIHCAYWLLFLLLLLIFYAFAAMAPNFAQATRQWGPSFFFWIRLMVGFAVIPAMLTFYVSYFFLFARFLAVRRVINFFIAALAVSFLSAIIGAWVESLPFLFGPRFLFGENYTSAFSIIIVMSFGAFIHSITGSVLQGFIRWYETHHAQEQLKQKHLQTELTLLRSKLSPHFLFNTLNNIDVLLQKDPERASTYLNALSDFLRYQLYKSDDDLRPFTEELEQIERFVELQRIRSDNSAFVSFRIEGNVNHVFLPPMLFLPFIENAFKHVSSRKEDHAIRICFRIENATLQFTCRNISNGDREASKTDSSGLGLDLMFRRLDLLYPGKHKIEVYREGRDFVVELNISI